MEWLVKLIFPRLILLAMRLGAKAFGKVRTRKHAILSRRWMYRHAWAPILVKFQNSKTKLDDPLIPFVYHNQVCCLEDGTARALIGQIRQDIANSSVIDALKNLDGLQVQLGLDDELD